MRSRELAVAFVVCFAAELVLNSWLIQMPPVWDAVGVFAPAVYLYETGFDLAGLLAMPGYLAGGPNIHSLSLSTLATVVAMWLAGGEPAFYLPGLHVLNFALAALTGAAAFWLSRPLLGGLAAALLAASVLVFPPFLVQSGALHTEMAGAALVLLGVGLLASHRLPGMAVCVLAACGVKTLGLIAVPSVLVLVAGDARIARGRRAIWCGGIVAGAALIETAKWLASPAPAREPIGLTEHMGFMLSHLAQVPDLALLMLLALAASGACIARALRLGLQATLDDDQQRSQLACALVPPACIAFIAIVPLSGADFIPLQRYYLWALAPALIAVAGAARQLGGARLVTIGLVVFVATAVANRSGRLYPDAGEPIRRFSIVERSYEYLDYYEVQRQGVRGLASIARERPAFVTRAASYYLSSPLMGWVDGPVANVHFVLEPPYDASHLSNFPSDFYVLELDSHPYHGQRVVLDLLAQAALRSDYDSIPVAEWKSGPYTAQLVRIRRKVAGGV